LKASNKFQNNSDTLTYNVNADATSDEIRKNNVKYLKIGLTKYLATYSLG